MWRRVMFCLRSFGRALRDKIFWLLALTAAAGLTQLPWWWVLPLTLAAISIATLPKYIALWTRAQAVGAERAWWRTVALSIVNSAVTVLLAYLVGAAVRWLFLP